MKNTFSFKNLIIGIVFTFLFSSCDDRDKFYESLNDSPLLVLEKGGIEIQEDSVKLSLKSGKSSIEVNAKVTDKNSKKITVSFNTGAGKIKINGSETTSMDAVVNNNYTISISPTALGVNEAVVTVVDDFDKAVSKNIRITAFMNLPPQASLQFAQIKNYEYELDATKSYDLDKNFGGNIPTYKYNINGMTVNVSDSKIRYNFGGPGSYPITLSVVDNDGAESSTVSLLLLIK